MKLVPIKDIFNLEKGTLQSSKATPGEYVFITAAAEWKTHKTYSQDKEALIFAAAASGSLGRTHYINGKFITSDLCFILTPKDTKKYPVNLQYYHQLFNSLRKEIVAKTKKGTSKDAISKQRLEQYCIPYLDIIKQDKLAIVGRQIAMKKNEFETEVSKQQKLITRLRQSILQDAVQGKLVPQDLNDKPASELLEKIKIEKEKLIKEGIYKKERVLNKIRLEDIPFKIPANWDTCKLGELVLNIKYGTSKKCDYISHDRIPVLRIPNVVKGTVELKDMKYTDLSKEEKEDLSLMENDILIIRSNGSREIVGRAVIINSGLVGYAYAGYLIRLRLVDKVYAPYILMILRSPFIRTRIEKPLRTTVGINNINSFEISNLPILLPPFREQVKIVEKVKKLFAQIDKLISENNKQQKLLEQLNYSFVS